MKKRAYVTLAGLFLFLVIATGSIYSIAKEPEYVYAAVSQSKYTMMVTSSRGMIYDCNMNPLVDQETRLVAAVAPTIETIGYLSAQMGEEERSFLASKLENGKPFLMELTERIEYDGIDIFEVSERYSENQPAAHLIGYLDSEGEGAAGIEKAMNDVLKNQSGSIRVDYRVDALGRVIAGDERVVTDTTQSSDAGVVLTIDRALQEFAENAAQKLSAGAVVVTEVPNCEVRAMVSVPGYSPHTLSDVADDEGAPLVNRTMQAYIPGSVFKLAVAAQELELDAAGYEYTCLGSVEVNGLSFSCYAGKAHGTVDLEGAIKKSCNCYFIGAARAMGAENVLAMAYNLGFARSIELGKDLISQPGTLPAIKDLSSLRALANFSFGQGELTATPLQIAGMVNTIASGGQYTEPKVIAGTVDADHRFVSSDYSAQTKKTQVMKRSTALVLQDYMEAAVKSGTASGGSPNGITAGAKTGTAQTGVFEGKDELNHFWYTGYICDDSGPRYGITVLRESTVTDEGAAAEVFKEISEFICGYAY